MAFGDLIKHLFSGAERIPSPAEIKALAAEIVAERRRQREAGQTAAREQDILRARAQRIQDAINLEVELQEQGIAGLETFTPIDRIREHFSGNVARTEAEYRWKP